MLKTNTLAISIKVMKGKDIRKRSYMFVRLLLIF